MFLGLIDVRFDPSHGTQQRDFYPVSSVGSVRCSCCLISTNQPVVYDFASG